MKFNIGENVGVGCLPNRCYGTVRKIVLTDRSPQVYVQFSPSGDYQCFNENDLMRIHVMWNPPLIRDS